MIETDKVRLTDIEKEYLRRFYSILRDNLRREKISKGPSVLISLMEMRSASRFKILSKSIISSNSITNDAMISLLSKNLIQVMGNIGEYVITSNGVWHQELELGIMDGQAFLQYLNQKYFSDQYGIVSEKGDLDDEEKIILLAMIAGRAFSEKSPVDLNDEAHKNSWLEILEKSYYLLNQMGLIKKEKEVIFHKGTEHIANFMFRHNNYCLQKTHGIYRYKGNYEYYLDVFKNGKLSEEEISYLFWKIFKGEIIQSVDTVVQFLNSVSNASIFLFNNMKEHIFSTPTFDSLVRQCLLNSIIAKDKWSQIA
jgi:hypothetical protein